MAKHDAFHVSLFREDGKTYGTPTWVWPAVVDGAPNVRGYNGSHAGATAPCSARVASVQSRLRV